MRYDISYNFQSSQLSPVSEEDGEDDEELDKGVSQPDNDDVEEDDEDHDFDDSTVAAKVFTTSYHSIAILSPQFYHIFEFGELLILNFLLAFPLSFPCTRQIGL